MLLKLRVAKKWRSDMRVRSHFYIVLLLFTCISAGTTAARQPELSAETVQIEQYSADDDRLHMLAANVEMSNSEEVIKVNAPSQSDAQGEFVAMQSTVAAPAWWTIGFYILLTIVVGSILIYLYIEHSRKVVAVRQEIEELKEENEQLRTELTRKISEIEKIAERLRKAEEELEEKSQNEGMAEIAAGVLHNVANVLSSVNSSNTFIQDTAKYSKVDGLIKANKLLREHIDHIDQFIFEDPRGKKLLNYYLKLEEPLSNHMRCRARLPAKLFFQKSWRAHCHSRKTFWQIMNWM